MPGSAFDLAAVDWADPAPFYLGDPELVQLADVTIKHSGLETLATGLLSGPGPSSIIGAFDSAQQLSHLPSKSLAAVVAGMAAGVTALESSSRGTAASAVPAMTLWRSGWQHPGVQRASLTWRIPDFLQQQGKLVSPVFESGQPGCSRKLKLWGAGGGAGVSLILEKELSNQNWGYPKFIRHTELQAKADRYLVGGAAVFKVDVTWLEKPAGT
ncbi:hypothetical protein ABPG75_013147 [Micractinium tetrahymenae]